MRYLLQTYNFSHKINRVRNVAVPAGIFQNATETAISMSQLLGQITATVHFSNAVPVLHIVRSETQSLSGAWFQDITTWELANFGMTGASSFFSDSNR